MSFNLDYKKSRIIKFIHNINNFFAYSMSRKLSCFVKKTKQEAKK